MALLGHILSPSCSKMAPRWPNIAQHSAKMRQKCSPRPPKSPKNLKKTIGFSKFFAIWLFASKIPKSGQDASQNGLKLVILKSKMAILGPSWRQVGQLSAILAATWPIFAPRWVPTDLQINPQTRPKSHLRPSWHQEDRQGAPNHPWSSNFQRFDPNFDSIFDPIFEHIFILLLQFLLQFPAAGLARWRLCARSALDIF